MARFKAICIKGYEGISQGEIVAAWQGSKNRMYYYKGFTFKLNMPQQIFWEHFVSLNRYYIVEKPPLKRRFRRPKKQFLRVEFEGISEAVLVQLYCCVFSYIELIKQINPEFIQTFNYSIVSTLEKLEHLYKVVPEYQFREAVADCEQVFKGIYKTALSIDIEMLPSEANYNQLLENFKTDNRILGEFFNQLNK